MTQPRAVSFINALLELGSSGHGPLLLVKIIIMFGLTIYLVFGLVVIRQVNLMTGTIKSSITPVLELVGYIHMIAAIVVWLAALVLL